MAPWACPWATVEPTLDGHLGGSAAVLGTLLSIVGLALLAWYVYERSRRKTHAVPAGLQPDITLPHQKEWELYHNALSLCSKKTRLCMAELGLPYRSHHIDLIETGAYQNLSREFLAVNPAATVPVLVHEGHPIYESHEQIRYAAEHAPEGTSLIPQDSALAAEMNAWIDRSSLIGDDPIKDMAASAGNAVPGLTVPLFATMVEDIPYTKILEGLLFHRLRQRPMLFLAMKRFGLARLFRKGPAGPIVRKSAREMHRHLDELAAQLEKTGGPWILGETFSLADVSWAVVLERLREADSLHVFIGEDLRPAVAAWWERLRARPSYHAAIALHEHPTVTRGLERIRAAKAADPELRRALEPAQEEEASP